MTREGVDRWYDDCYDDDSGHWDDNNNEYKFFEWYNGCKKRKAQKAQIKEELMPTAWHPDHGIGVYQKTRRGGGSKRLLFLKLFDMLRLKMY